MLDFIVMQMRKLTVKRAIGELAFRDLKLSAGVGITSLVKRHEPLSMFFFILQI